MSAALPPTPTIRDALSLASRIEHEPLPSTPISDLLQSIVSLCNDDWVRNFLFTPDAIELSHLVSPTLPSTAVTCTLSTTRVAPPTVLPDPLDTYGDSQHIAGHYLFVPAFSANGATLGFGVMNVRANAGDIWASNFQLCPSKRLFSFRFVRDSRRSIMLEVFDIPEDNVVVVFYVQYLSSTEYRSCHSVFLRGQLLATVNDVSKAPTVDTMLPALLIIQEETQRRPCRICCRPMGVPCDCTMHHIKPAHPFDVGHFAKWMKRSLGEYEGVSRKRTFWQGVERRSIALGTRLSLQGFVDPSVVVSLSSATVTQLMRRLTEDPRMSAMLSTVADLRHASPRAPYFDTLLTGTVSRMPGNDTSVGQEDSNLIARITGSSPSHAGGPSTTSANDSSGDEWWTSRSVRETAVEVQDVLIGSALPVDQEESLEKADRGENGPPAQYAVPKFVDQSCKSNASADAKLIEKRRKAEARRARNRAAAHRSNLRAKAIRDGLLSELKICREKVNKLRVREMVLRQENLKLRKAKTERA